MRKPTKKKRKCADFLCRYQYLNLNNCIKKQKQNKKIKAKPELKNKKKKTNT